MTMEKFSCPPQPIADWTFGKHLLVTGASSGIGREISRSFIGRCRKLTLVARNQNSKLDTLMAELNAMQAQADPSIPFTVIAAHSLDVCNREGTSALVRQIYEKDKDVVDAFINCAGGCHVYGPLETLGNEDIEHIFDTNAKAPIYWLRELLPRMKHNQLRQGDLKRAHVLMLSSRSGERALPHLSVYSAAKGALEKLIEAVRNEYACERIVFTLVNPGSVDTAFTDNWFESAKETHKMVSMTVEESVQPIVQALASQFAINKLSYESVEQWLIEPGVHNCSPQLSSLTINDRNLK